MATLITSGVDYARFFDDLRAVIRQEIAGAQNTTQAAPEVGDIALAQEVTGLSKQRIYGLVSERAIPHSKRGNKLYFTRTELLGWVAAGSREVAKGTEVASA
ncbi:DNA-binding protein [Hymenobacter aquaticus]|uniref:DNA-binding protein n=1 Tax=Hymenobacter aquaticus TaxID=1867101 RepID=A0A4Z0Q578_9BACT|nr:helix-turn-helix domain-containing protein [Hymenobacter aquaticus]TGE24764.1 DNA-binding protein [Hymenobacter aquaticus]